MSEEKQLAETQKPAIESKFQSMGGLIPTTFDQLYRLSQVMAASGMMPNGIKTVPAVFVAVEMGLEIGLSPMQSVQNIAVINGRPSLWGDSVLGIVRASGKLEDFDEYFENENEGDKFTAVCNSKRKGEKKPIVRKFSVADAKIAGLWGKQGPWQNYPKRMLQMRARSWALRDGFGDVLKGLHVAEEVMDIDMKAKPTGEFTVDTNGQGDEGNPFTELKAEGFDALIPENIDKGILNNFLAFCANYYKKSIIEIKTEAKQDMPRFLIGFEKWQAKQKGTKKKTPKKTAQESKIVRDGNTATQDLFGAQDDEQSNEGHKDGDGQGQQSTIFKQLQDARAAVPELYEKAIKTMNFGKTSINEDQAAALVKEINRLADGG